MKLTFTPTYATANTVRFDEQVESKDWLAKPVIGAWYLPHETVQTLGLKLQAGDPYQASGANGKTFTRRDLTGEGIVLNITKA